jgi:hypothetical protein
MVFTGHKNNQSIRHTGAYIRSEIHKPDYEGEKAKK